MDDVEVLKTIIISIGFCLWFFLGTFAGFALYSRYIHRELKKGFIPFEDASGELAWKEPEK